MIESPHQWRHQFRVMPGPPSGVTRGMCDHWTFQIRLLFRVIIRAAWRQCHLRRHRDAEIFYFIQILFIV